MAELNTNWSVSTVAPVSGVHDYATGWIQVGNELNKQYWQNRQAHLENLTALSKVEASEYGQGLLNQVRSEYDTEADKFEKDGNWHKAGNFIYDMAQKLITDPRLPAIAKDKAQYDAFMKSVADSDWSTSDKEGFSLRAHHASSDLKFEDGVVSGGFIPINIGKPFNMSEYSKDVLNIIKNVNADSATWREIIADPKALKALGLPSITNNKGETIISHMLISDIKSETVTPEKVQAAALQLMLTNEEAQEQIFQETTNRFYRNYYDKATKTFKGLSEEDRAKIFGHQYYGSDGKELTLKFIESTLGLNRSDYWHDDGKGKKVFNKTKVKSSSWGVDYESINDKCEEFFGVSLEELYTKPLNDKVINNVASLYTMTYLDNNTGGSGSDDPKIYTLALQELIKNNWTDTISSITGTAINLYAYNKIDKQTKAVENPAFAIELKAQKDKEAAAEAEAKRWNESVNPNAYPSLDIDKAVTDPNYLKNNLEYVNKLSNDINVLKVNNQQIYKKLLEVDKEMLLKLGLGKEEMLSQLASDKVGNKEHSYTQYLTGHTGTESKPAVIIDDNALANANINDLDANAKRNGYYDDPNYQDVRNSIISLQSNNLKISEIQDLQDAYKHNVKQLYKAYNEDPEYYKGWGWYGVGSDTALFIANNNITSVAEFKEKVKKLKPHNFKNPYVVRAPGKNDGYIETGNTYSKHGLGSINLDLSDQEIQEEIANVIDNITHRYEKKTGKPFEFVRNTYTLSNHSVALEKDLATRKAAWASSDGALQVVSLANGKPGGEILPQQIASLINLNQFPVTITTSSKGVTIKEQNLANNNSTPINGEIFGIDGDIYSTEIKYSLNPLDQAEGYMSYNIICKGKSGEYLGTISCREQDAHISNFMLNVYDQFNVLAEKGNTKAKEAIGILINDVNETAYTFNSTTAQPAKNLTELKFNIDNMLRLGKNGFIYTMNSQNIMGGNLISPMQIKITRVSNGYVIEDLSETNSNTKGKIIIPKDLRKAFEKNNIKIDDVDTKWNGETVFTTLELAFKNISEFNLELSSALRRLNPQISQ